MINLKLKRDSWENIIAVIKKSEMKPEGNFWASIQRLEEQLTSPETKAKEEESIKAGKEFELIINNIKEQKLNVMVDEIKDLFFFPGTNAYNSDEIKALLKKSIPAAFKIAVRKEPENIKCELADKCSDFNNKNKICVGIDKFPDPKNKFCYTENKQKEEIK